MNIIIPMAGAGSRFSKAGFTLPKPLIDVYGQPMYHWAVNSLPLQHAQRLVFVLRQDQFTDQLIEDIKQTYAAYDPKIKVLDHLTRGQAETVYLAKDLLELNQPTLIHNADTAFESMQMPSEQAFGGLVVFEPALNDARWSFARLDSHSNKVVEVREKKVISRHASTGTYYFADTAWLMYTIHQHLAEGITEQDEYYIAPLYNCAIAQSQWIELLPCTRFTCLGTPEELEAALPHIPQLQHSQQGSLAF